LTDHPHATGSTATPSASGRPKVSILIPVHNQERWIEDCVRSALAQSYPYLEVVVSDNASTDRTGEIVSALMGDRRLRYARNETDIGRVRNYRRLVHDLATGDWVLMLDGDDLLLDEDYVSKAIELAASDPEVVLVFGKMLQGSSVHSAKVRNEGCQIPTIMDGNTFFLRHLPFDEIGLFHLTVLYRRDAALALDIYDRNFLSVDFDAFYRLILGHKIGFVDAVAGLWRQHGHNTSQRYDYEALRENFAALRRPFEQALATGIAPRPVLERWLRVSTARFLLICMKSALRLGRYRDVARFITSLAADDPHLLATVTALGFRRLAGLK
jgi:glycosyltransferase involved in cell wall biosynthesis